MAKIYFPKDWFRYNKSRTTNTLTKIIIVFGFTIIIVLSWVIINIAGDSEKLETSKWVFNATIPLIATWVGTVIAYYYGKDNYESATAQALALTRENLDDLRVENIMINVKTIVAQKISQDDYKVKKLKKIIELYDQVDKDRIPIFSPQSNPSFIIHKISMKNYINSKNANERENLTLQNLIEDNKKKFSYEKKEGFVTVLKSSTIKEAIEKMQAKGCKDVFITDNGNERGKVIGWLTDTLAERFLQV